MSYQSISKLKDKHPKSDIYVIGSGPSLNFIDASFFSNKIVICVNGTISHVSNFAEAYLVAKEPHETMQDMAFKKKASIVMCLHHSGVETNPLNKVCYPDITYVFKPMQSIIKDTKQTDALERSSSTIVTGIHLAAFLGAKNVILVGHDCGFINGNVHVTGYDKKHAVTKGGNAYNKWMANNKVEKKSIEAKKLLKQFYDVNVYSLNPFINFGLEGNKYKAFK